MESDTFYHHSDVQSRTLTEVPTMIKRIEDLIAKEDIEYQKHPARDAGNVTEIHLQKPESRTPGHAQFKNSSTTDKRYTVYSIEVAIARGRVA